MYHGNGDNVIICYAKLFNRYSSARLIIKMATVSKPFETNGDSKEVTLTKKIAELKKRLILAEGQKKATSEEWDGKEKKCLDTITDLKKEIKDLTGRLISYININDGKYSEESCEAVRTVGYPVGVDSAEKALEVYDLQIINQTKKYDLLEAEFVQRKEHYNKLQRLKAESIAIRNAETGDETSNNKTKSNRQNQFRANCAPLTIEEDENRKLICHLENEIIRTNMQCSQAEHIRKKYKSIQASLMTDAEKFEKNLLELEDALRQQNVDIDKMKEVHLEAIHMRDATKIVTLRQEHSAQASTKSRTKLAFDFRQQVDDHRIELERLERRLLTTTKTVMQQGSTESLNDVPLTAKASPQSAKGSSDIVIELENKLKVLMQTTGATSPEDLLERFTAQKEAMQRLNYLRTVTEAEKRHLEMERDQLASQLEQLKFSDTKENEVNQEYLEDLKKSITEKHAKEHEFLQASLRSTSVLNSIKLTIFDLIHKLEEVYVSTTGSIEIESNDNTSNNALLQMLEDKLKKGLKMTGEYMGDDDSGLDVDTEAFEIEEPIDPDKLSINLRLPELLVPIISSTMATPRSTRSQCPTEGKAGGHEIEIEKTTPYPMCYSNLLAGRATGVSTSTSPGQTAQPAVSDDEAEVPSRNLIKRQALILVDSKARRKGYRAPPKRK